MSRVAVLSLLITSLSVGSVAHADPKAEAAPLAGVWLPDGADSGAGNYLNRIWWSKFTIKDNTFAVTRVMTHSKDLTGTFTLDPTTNPKSIDLKVNELDFRELGVPAKFPAMTLPGIYKLDGGRLTVCFHVDPELKRPTTFDGPGKKTVVLTLGRAAPAFKDFPKEVAVTVKDPDGRPVPDAVTYYHTYQTRPHGWKGGVRQWKYVQSYKTGANGTVRMRYDDIGQGVRARAAERHLIGFAPATPYSLQAATLTVDLEPAVRVTGSVVSDELKKAGQSLGWVMTILHHRGTPVASSDAPGGAFDYVLPPGEYELEAYGTDLRRKTIPVHVHAGQSEVTIPPINLSASALALLKGKPAPELVGVVGWKGQPVKLADLKGKIVLLEYWGYWCGPCVHSMPVLLELHETFKDKGLAIIGVHLDIDGEVDTAAKLDEKLVDIRKKLWQDRDLPFPVALASGRRVEDGKGDALRGGPALQYGIPAYPTTVLIGRDGKVAGTFGARDAKAAVQKMEQLLAEKK
jgi:uncharacterized protein (TIGR03067 family)